MTNLPNPLTPIGFCVLMLEGRLAARPLARTARPPSSG